MALELMTSPVKLDAREEEAARFSENVTIEMCGSAAERALRDGIIASVRAPIAAPGPYQVRVAVKAGLHTVGVTSPRENLKIESDAPGGTPGGRGGAAQLPSPVDLRLNGARIKRFVESI